MVCSGHEVKSKVEVTRGRIYLDPPRTVPVLALSLHSHEPDGDTSQFSDCDKGDFSLQNDTESIF